MRLNQTHIRLGHYFFDGAYCLSVKNKVLALELSMHIRQMRDKERIRSMFRDAFDNGHLALANCNFRVLYVLMNRML